MFLELTANSLAFPSGSGPQGRRLYLSLSCFLGFCPDGAVCLTILAVALRRRKKPRASLSLSSWKRRYQFMEAFHMEVL